MKKLFALLITAFMLSSAMAETTKVCVDVKDKVGEVVKDAKGKVKQTCKEMKVHQKLEGTKVPEKK